MHPILIDFGTWDLPLAGTTHLFLPTYGLLFALGALAAGWWFLKRTASIGIAAEPAFNLAFYSVLGGLAGAKLTLILVDWRYYLDHPADILASIRSAGVLMGGVVAGAIVFIAYCVRQRLPLHRLGDAIAAPLAFAQGVGRMGCFSAGCCYGKPTSSWFHVVFHDAAAHAQTGVPLGVPLVPTQLLQMALDMTLAGILTVMWRRRVQPEGSCWWWFMILYGISRFTVEVWRGDEVRGLWFGGLISTSQILSLLSVAVGAAFLVARGRAARTAAA